MEARHTKTSQADEPFRALLLLSQSGLPVNTLFCFYTKMQAQVTLFLKNNFVQMYFSLWQIQSCGFGFKLKGRHVCNKDYLSEEIYCDRCCSVRHVQDIGADVLITSHQIIPLSRSDLRKRERERSETTTCSVREATHFF